MEGLPAAIGLVRVTGNRGHRVAWHLRLQITVHDAVAVQVLQCPHELPSHVSHNLFWQRLIVFQYVRQLPYMAPPSNLLKIQYCTDIIHQRCQPAAPAQIATPVETHNA